MTKIKKLKQDCLSLKKDLCVNTCPTLFVKITKLIKMK